VISSSPWQSLHTALGWVEPHLIHSKGYQLSNRHTDYYIAYWVEKGRLRLSNKGRVQEATDGEWLFQHPCLPGQTHYNFQWDPHSTGFEVAFHLRWDGPGHLLLPSRHTIWKSSPLPNLCAQTWQLYETAHNIFPIVGHPIRNDPISMEEHFKLKREFHLWFMILIDEWDHMGDGINHVVNIDEKIATAERTLRVHPWDQPLSIQKLAHKTGYSTKHFTMLFRQYYGHSPLVYRMRIKQDRIIHMLQTTDLSIGEIARQFGVTQTRLGIWLKQRTGMTPTEIRNGNSPS
jgi:AraC-like DNA-binding protein